MPVENFGLCLSYLWTNWWFLRLLHFVRVHLKQSFFLGLAKFHHQGLIPLVSLLNTRVCSFPSWMFGSGISLTLCGLWDLFRWKLSEYFGQFVALPIPPKLQTPVETSAQAFVLCSIFFFSPQILNASSFPNSHLCCLTSGRPLHSCSDLGKESSCNTDMDSIPGSGRSLEKGMATHSSIPAWRISRTGAPAGLIVHGVTKSRLSD